MNQQVEHITAHATNGIEFLSGCTCGEVFPRRSTLQGTMTDELIHRRRQQQQQIRLVIPPCTEPDCPVCSNHS